HRDDAELVVEHRQGIERRLLADVADGRVQAPAGDRQHGEAGPGLLVVDADLALLVERHGFLPAGWRCVAVEPSGNPPAVATEPSARARCRAGSPSDSSDP